VRRVVRRLNPNNDPGRLSLVTRFGADNVETLLPPLLRAMKSEGVRVVWLCDPMHGNTRKNHDGRKTRHYDDIFSEISRFWDIHRAEGTIAGGVHLELTGAAVTECVGGHRNLSDKDLALNYETACDPRLNAEQAVELAFSIAGMLHH
jgi:3-deoxy-7-phosphoheptulonate synthase